MSSPLTKNHLDEALKTIGQRFDGVSAEMTDNTRDIIRHFTEGQNIQNERIDGLDAKLDAIIEMLAMRKELHNLVRVLKAQGVQINESEVFVN